MAGRDAPVPLTSFQLGLARLLAANRSPDSHLAGGAALHFHPNSTRYSNDLDYFHDSVERVASAYKADRQTLDDQHYAVSVDLQQPGYVRVTVTLGHDQTKIEWAHDSAWRFMPAIASEDTGYQLHPIDLAINKVLALAGRDEARDFLDVLMVHREVLPLGALCWAAVGKDPGFTPLSLLELIKRRGKNRPEDFQRLRLSKPVDLPTLKTTWLTMLEGAAEFIDGADPNEIGCLYYDDKEQRFLAPTRKIRASGHVHPHYGRPGGVLPRMWVED